MNGLTADDGEPLWRKLRLTLERPYTDDQGNPIRQLLDVTPEGQQIYEPCARVPFFIYRGDPLMPFPGPQNPTSSLQRTSVECLLSEVTTFLRRGTLQTGELTSGTPMDLMTSPKRPVLKPPARLRSL